MSYTKEELIKMGATPGSNQVKKSYTVDDLKSIGAIPGTTQSKITESGIDQSYQTTKYTQPTKFKDTPEFYQNRDAGEASFLDTKSQQQYKPSFPYSSKTMDKDKAFDAKGWATNVGKTTGNLPSSAINMIKGLSSLVTSPIQSLKGIKGLIAGSIQKLIPGQQKDEAMVDALVENYKERYGSYENLRRTVVNDPFGFGTELYSAIRGVAGMAGHTALLNAITGSAGSAVAKPISSAYLKAKNITDNLRNKMFGGISDLGNSNLKTALSGNKDYLNAMRKKITPDDIIGMSSESKKGLDMSLKNLKTDTRTDYGKASKALDNIKSTIPAESIANTFKKWIGRNAKELSLNKDGSLNFSETKLVNDIKAQDTISKIYTQLKNTKSNLTPYDINKYKVSLSPFFSGKKDMAISLVKQLQDDAVGLIEKMPEYKALGPKYKTALKSIDIVERELKAVTKLIETNDIKKAVKRLVNLAKKDPESREVLFRALSDSKGSSIVPTLQGLDASRLMSPLTQRLLRWTGIGAVLGKSSPVLFLLGAISSPKVTAELFNLLGKWERTTSKVGKFLNPNISKAVVPAATIGKEIPFLPNKVGQNSIAKPKVKQASVIPTTKPQKQSSSFNITNMVYVGQEGATRGENKSGNVDWASFKTLESNIKAVIRDFEAKIRTNPDITVNQLINRLSPKSDDNKPSDIAVTVVDEVWKKHTLPDGGIKINGNYKLKDLTSQEKHDLVLAISVAEGHKEYQIKDW